MDRQNLTLFLRFVCLIPSISFLDFVVAYILDTYLIAGIGRIVGLGPLPSGGYAATRYLRSLITLSLSPDGHNVVNTLSWGEAIGGLPIYYPCKGNRFR